jgi:predicted TIM-barrel fold metal-dependent hydrolase
MGKGVRRKYINRRKEMTNIARFVVDTHVHSQRHAAGTALKGSKDYGDLGRAMSQVNAYDNSARLIYDMERYGVDMCILQPAFGMSNEISLEQVRKHPDKFVANCQAGLKHTRDKVAVGEIEWTIEAALEELDALLKTGSFVGIGEGMPMMAMKPPEPGKPPEIQDEKTTFQNMFKICELARAYKVPIRYHCGMNVGYESGGGTGPNWNPLWARNLATNFPEVPIILEHAGIEGWWWEQLYEGCLFVAAGSKNVYLETGRWWTELYDKPLRDRNIGAEKLIWGTDWGASLPVQRDPAGYPETFTEQVRKDGIVRHQVDVWGWQMKQLWRLNIPQDDLNLIMGGNAVRIYNLRTPGGLTRMFKFID